MSLYCVYVNIYLLKEHFGLPNCSGNFDALYLNRRLRNDTSVNAHGPQPGKHGPLINSVYVVYPPYGSIYKH